MSKDLRVQLVTPLVRFSYSVLDVPRIYKDPATGREQGAPKYRLTAIFDADQISKFHKEEDGKLVDVSLDKLAKELAKQKWPDLSLEEMFPKKTNGDNNWPIKRGDRIIELNAKKPKPKKLDFLAGKIQVGFSANAEYPPTLKYRDPVNGMVELDRDNPDHMKKIKKLFAAGNYGFIEFSMVPNEIDGKCYVTLYLNSILFKKEGDRIGGGSSMLDRFDGIDGGEGDFDPTNDNDFGGNDL